MTKHVTSSVSPVILFLAGPGIKRDAMTSLRNLKDLVESATPHEPDTARPAPS